MKNIDEKEKDFQKNKETEITKQWNLDTANDFADILEARTYPAELTEFIGGIFEAAAKRNNLWFGNPDYARAVLPVLFNECEDYREMTVCMIDSIHKMESVRRSFKQPNQKFSVDLGDGEHITGDLELDNLALSISGLINNERLPEVVRSGLKSALVEIYNEHIDQTEINDYQSSPEYIAMILRGAE